MSDQIGSFLLTSLEILTAVFLFVIGLVVLWAIVAYIVDISQTQQAIRRNYPVIGRFRYFFEHLGNFFRQYFFAMDREELPFNRAERSWVYRAAKDLNNTVAFGSTRRPRVRVEDDPQLEALLEIECGRYQMRWRISYSDRRKRVAVFVSKTRGARESVCATSSSPTSGSVTD